MLFTLPRRRPARPGIPLLTGLIIALTAITGQAEPTRNGFDLSNTSIPVEEILPGGPPRDGIPAIDNPRFQRADEATELGPGDRVLGISRHGVSKAYPLAILNWHEVVNDEFGDEPIAVTFCPLCGTGMAFKAEVAGKARRFGVSGLLYNSDVLLYDRASESLWSQIASEAVSGPLLGTPLEAVPVSHTSWADWRERHPDTLVLSRDTGAARNYDRDPYEAYTGSERLYFPVANLDRRYHPKEQVVGLTLKGETRAYPFVELAATDGRVEDTVAGQAVVVEYDLQHRTGRVLDAEGREIPTVIAFWFAWAAFHPQTSVFTADDA